MILTRKAYPNTATQCWKVELLVGFFVGTQSSIYRTDNLPKRKKERKETDIDKLTLLLPIKALTVSFMAKD